MQTFLPYPSFVESVRVLDYRRLGKQRLEAKQIVTTLRHSRGAWMNHPAVRMWAGYIPALCVYGMHCCNEWVRRGYTDNMFDFFAEPCGVIEPPNWIGDEDFHSSHRANLLRKDPEYYSQFGWTDSPDLPYVWPISFKARK